MTDIVERLRELARHCMTSVQAERLMHEAAIEIEALRFDLDEAGIARREKEAVELVELRAEIERLRADHDLTHTALIKYLRGQGLLVRHEMCTRPDNTLGPAWVLRSVHSAAGGSCLGWHEDDPVKAVEAAMKGKP